MLRAMSSPADPLVNKGDPLLVTVLAAQRLTPIAALAAYARGASPFVVGAIAASAAIFGVIQAARASRLARIVFSTDLDRTMLALGERSPARVRGGSHDEMLGAIWRALHARQMLARGIVSSLWASAIAFPIAAALVAMNGVELAAVVLGAFVVGLFVRLPLARRHREAVNATYELYGAVVSDLGHALRGLDDLQAHGLGDRLRRTLREHAGALARAESVAVKRGVWATWLPLAAGTLVLAPYVFLRSGGAGWSHIALEGAWLAGLGPIAVTLARALVDRTRQRGDAQILDALCALPPDLPVRSPSKSPDTLAPIELDAVTFRYPAPIDAERLTIRAASSNEPNAAVIDDVSITWSGDEPLALVGANGSGKSTVLALMLRLVDPTEGHVRIGGVDLRDVDPRTFRDRIAYVPQRPLVLEGMTVREAVKLVAPDAKDDAILSALDVVGLRKRLDARGGDPLSIKCAALSVGEAQRVALARALVRDAELLVLDEPEAGLDPDARQSIRALLDRLAREGHRIVVATQHEEVVPDGAAVLRLPVERGARITVGS
jgi:ABC-type multidrug transport system fused ATPase/permease subunit